MLNGADNNITRILLLAEGRSFAASTTRHGIQGLGRHLHIDDIAITNGLEVDKRSKGGADIAGQHNIHQRIDDGKIRVLDHRIGKEMVAILLSQLHTRQALHLGKVSSTHLIGLLGQGNRMVVRTHVLTPLLSRLMVMIVSKSDIAISVAVGKHDNFISDSHLYNLLYKL